MGGVDRADLRKSINSYILYKLEKNKKGEKPRDHSRFPKTLAEQSRGPYRQHREQASTNPD